MAINQSIHKCLNNTGGCCTLVVVEMPPPPYKVLWVPRKALYKCNKLINELIIITMILII